MGLTNVSATGTAAAEYDVAAFHLTVTENDKTASGAKEKTKKVTDQLDKILDGFEIKGLKVTKGTLRSSVFVGIHHEYNHTTNKNVKKGYNASYQMSFQTENVDLVNDLYDALIGVESEGLTVHSPSFKVKNIDELHQIALKDAWARVRSRFNSECSVLGLKSASYVIEGYSVRYDESKAAEDGLESTGGARMYAAAASPMGGGGGGSRQLEINSGKANIRATLTVAFVRGTEQTGV